MPDSPFTWKPTEILVVTNVSHENLLLDLPSGLLRLDAGRRVRITASATKQPGFVILFNEGKIQVEPYRQARSGLGGFGRPSRSASG